MKRPKNVRRRRIDHAQRLLEWVCQKHRLSVKTLRGQERFPHIVAARREFIRLCKERNIGCVTIGKVLNRHHGTVLHHIYSDRSWVLKESYRPSKVEPHAHPL